VSSRPDFPFCCHPSLKAEDLQLLFPLHLPSPVAAPDGNPLSPFSTTQANRVIPTEAAHSLIVSGAVEGPPHFVFVVVFVFVVALVFVFSLLLSSFAESGGPALLFPLH
jgi:hypothetical protein